MREFCYNPYKGKDAKEIKLCLDCGSKDLSNILTKIKYKKIIRLEIICRGCGIILYDDLTHKDCKGKINLFIKNNIPYLACIKCKKIWNNIDNIPLSGDMHFV